MQRIKEKPSVVLLTCGGMKCFTFSVCSWRDRSYKQWRNL